MVQPLAGVSLDHIPHGTAACFLQNVGDPDSSSLPPCFVSCRRLIFEFASLNTKCSLFCVVKYGILGHRMAMESRFGDGTPISVAEMHEIRSAIHKNMVYSRWRKGDCMFIDNFSTSHGRQPTYDKKRKIVVAWSDPMTKLNNMTEA